MATNNEVEFEVTALTDGWVDVRIRLQSPSRQPVLLKGSLARKAVIRFLLAMTSGMIEPVYPGMENTLKNIADALCESVDNESPMPTSH